LLLINPSEQDLTDARKQKIFPIYYLNHGDKEEERNVEFFIKDNKIFARASKNIDIKQELLTN